MENKKESWFKKHWAATLLGVVAVSSLATGDSTPTQGTTYVAPVVQPVYIQETKVQETKTAEKVTPTTQYEADLSNDNYYTNVNGNTVHSPAYSTDGDVPYGASARCRDGTYSFSQNRRGTCSHHGGVAEWL